MSITPFCGTVSVPPDKSISHRALMFASMVDGRSELSNLLDSQDVRSTLACMRALGASIETRPSVNSGAFDATVHGWGLSGPSEPTQTLDCGNSGTTARLLLGIIAGWPIRATLTGDDSLKQRPMARIAEPLSQMGAKFYHKDKSEWQAGQSITLPLTIEGTAELKAINYKSPKASAQVKTAILLAALRCVDNAICSIDEPSKSRDHTELMLPAFGASLSAEGSCVSLKAGSTLHSCDVCVPGDPSSAAFLMVAAAMVPGSDISIEGLCLNPTRTGAFDVAKQMGCDISIEPVSSVGGELCGNVHITYTDGLRGVVVRPDQIPSLIDEIPILALLATHAKGTTIFESVSELRVKESNRLEAIVSGLNALGCEAKELGNDLVIEGKKPSIGVDLDSNNDHRLAMTWTLANICHGFDAKVKGMSCIDVSYPEFEKVLDKLRAKGGSSK